MASQNFLECFGQFWNWSWGSRRSVPALWKALEPGAVGEAVRHDDVLVEVVGACGAVIFHLVDHLADREDGGGRGVGLQIWGGRGWGDALGAGLVGVTFICIHGKKGRDTHGLWLDYFKNWIVRRKAANHFLSFRLSLSVQVVYNTQEIHTQRPVSSEQRKSTHISSHIQPMLSCDQNSILGCHDDEWASSNMKYMRMKAMSIGVLMWSILEDWSELLVLWLK